MTRKDYELIAEVIADLYEQMNCTSYNDTVSLHLVASELAFALASKNERFNRDTFMKACKVESK
jgi:hypothetical protein